MDRRWCAGLLLLAGTAGVAGCGQASSQTGPPPQPDPVVTYDTPISQVVTDYEEFPGRTEATYTVEVRARVSGYLKRVYFQDGQEVRQGDGLFMIDPRPFQATLDRTKGAHEQAEAHSQRLNNEYRRAKLLYEQGRSISREEFDRYAFDHAEAEAALSTAKANMDLAALDLDWTKVTADLPEGMVGRLSRRMVDPGNLVKADDTMMTTIVTQDPLHVYFDVHEQAMLKIGHLVQEGKIDPAKIPVDISLSDEQGFPHRGIVNFTDNRVDVNTGTLRFRAELKNPNYLIKPGLFVRVRVTIGDPHPAIMIHEQSLQTDQSQKKVFLLTQMVDKQGKPEFGEIKDKEGKKTPAAVCKAGSVNVVPGVLRGEYREIKEGIKPGDQVVVSGMQKIRVGAKPNTKTKENPEGVPYTVLATKYNPATDLPPQIDGQAASSPASPLSAGLGNKSAGSRADPGGTPAAGSTPTAGPESSRGSRPTPHADTRPPSGGNSGAGQSGRRGK